MKKLIFPLLFCLFITSIALSQTQRGDYKKFDYIKVEGNQLDQFIALAKNEIKTSYQSLIDSGDLKGWCLYQIRYPGGEKSAYDFISIATASDLTIFEDQFSQIVTPTFIPDSSSKSTKDALNNTSSIIKSELWTVENRIIGSDSAKSMPPYMTMDYMNVSTGKDLDYLMLEDEVAKPIHVERVDIDQMAGWEVYSLLLPGGLNYGYNFATANFYEKLAQVEFGFTDEVINQALGENVNIPELFNTINTTRDQVNVELWKLAVESQ